MSIEHLLSSGSKSSAFSPIRVVTSEKLTPVISPGVCTGSSFGCLRSTYPSSYPFIYPSVINPAFSTQRYYSHDGIVPILDPKGVVQHIGSYLHHAAAPMPGMFGYPIEDEKPSQSYIGLIGKAILSTPQKKLVLSDIYNYILTNYPYFRNKGPGWRNSIRHNLSLNECFIKVGRSPNGKGHFWAINPSNYEDFSKGEYRRKRASKKRSGGENNKQKNTCKEKDVPSKPETKLDDTKVTASPTGTIMSGFYGTYSVAPVPNKTTVPKENKGFHIETLLSGLVREQSSLSSPCLTRGNSEHNGLKTAN